jgi:hypothetical protein
MKTPLTNAGFDVAVERAPEMVLLPDAAEELDPPHPLKISAKETTSKADICLKAV